MHTTLKKLLCVCIFLLAGGGASTSWAADLSFVFFDIEPYAKADADGTKRGRYVGFAEKIAKKLNANASVNLVPFARLPFAIAIAPADITFSFSTDALEKSGLPLTVLEQSTSVVLMGTGRQEKQLDALAGLQIGRLRGGCQDLAQRAIPIQYFELNNASSGVRMLAAQRLDGICATRHVLEHYMAQEKLEWQQFGPAIEVSRRDVWVFVSKTMPLDQQQALRRGIAELRKEGRL